MKVILRAHTPLHICSEAIRTCWDSHDKSDGAGAKDKALIDRVANKMKHGSVKNHISYTFNIQGISTKTLLALTRHDVGTEFSVQSSRYTCQKSTMSFTRTDSELCNKALDKIIAIINDVLKEGASCDNISMLLPQAYQYNLYATFSLQALQHFLSLRLARDAHYDIRELAKQLKDNIPEDHKYLY